MATATSSSQPFAFPPHYSFPPFYTRQPTQSTYAAQLQKWSALILAYSAHSHLFKLSLSAALDSDLFYNRKIGKRLSPADAKEVVAYMVKEGRAEWVKGDKRDKEGGSGEEFWVWWRTVEEWASKLYDWVDGTGSKNTVLTLYELTESQATAGQDFHGMDPELLQRALGVLVKRGKAQVFGQEDGMGVKFF